MKPTSRPRFMWKTTKWMKAVLLAGLLGLSRGIHANAPARPLYCYHFDTTNAVTGLDWRFANAGTGKLPLVRKCKDASAWVDAFGSGALDSANAFWSKTSTSLWLQGDAAGLGCSTDTGFTISFWTADCDWRGVKDVQILDGATLDVAGHAVRLAACSGGQLGTATVTDGTGGGALHLDVAAGATQVNDSIRLTDALKLVKDGAGTLLAAAEGQTYSGGTVVAAGTLAFGRDGSDCPIGSTGAVVRVEAGATLDMNGTGRHLNTTFILAGGTLYNGKGIPVPEKVAQLGTVRLEADSTLVVDADYGFVHPSTGVFAPEGASHPNVELQNGATIDLSSRSGAWSARCFHAHSSTTNFLTAAAGAQVTVDLSGRTDLRELSKAANPHVVTWDGAEIPASVVFAVDSATAQNRFYVRRDATGLRLCYSSGTVLFVR